MAGKGVAGKRMIHMVVLNPKTLEFLSPNSNAYLSGDMLFHYVAKAQEDPAFFGEPESISVLEKDSGPIAGRIGIKFPARFWIVGCVHGARGKECHPPSKGDLGRVMRVVVDSR